MNETTITAGLIISETTIAIALLSALLAAAAGYLFAHRQTVREREVRIRLATQLEAEQRHGKEQLALLESARQQLSDSFAALAGNALKQNSSEFLKLARENLNQFQVEAKGELGAREKAVENLIKPIRETLEKTDQQLRQMEKERQSSHGSLTRHLEMMAEAQRQLQGETQNLVKALRRPEVRGQWGEMTLKRLAELSGMVEHCDFYEQTQVEDEAGRRHRPDMVIRMPDSREVVVDAKTPLDAYLDAVEATDDAARQQALERHTRNVRNRVKELAAKAYWQQFKQSPDFVVLFIPGDQFLSSALDIDPGLLEEAMSQKVILATPTSLVALLRAVGFGWRQESLAQNAEAIRQLGEEFHLRLATFSEHLGKLGKSLESSVGHFNSAVGSFDSRILPGARKFEELGIRCKKELKEPGQIEKGLKQLNEQSDCLIEPSVE